MERDIVQRLEQRLGRIHARQRLGIEKDHEAQIFGQGISFFHLENWYSIHSFIRNSLRLAGLYGRGKRNTLDIQVRHNNINLLGLPAAFDGFTLLHLSDLHVDMHLDNEHAMIQHIMTLDYDVCILTGDYRFKSFGSHEAALEGMKRIRSHLKDPVYGILGNHDTVRMVPGLEEAGIQMLLNESAALEWNGSMIHLVGIDDAHFFRADNIEKAVQDVPHDEFSILLSHTPEIYRQAAHADFNLMLCGHTHGGQICLPGGYPITLDARCPRFLGKGPWKYHNMLGYTSPGAGASVVSVRLNCPPEITLHHLHTA